MEFRAMNGLVSETARTDEFLRGLDFLLQFVRCQIEVWNIRACGALQEAGQRLAQKLSRLSAGDAPLPVKFQNNEFARSRVGWRWKKFCDGFGDLKSHISNSYFIPLSQFSEGRKRLNTCAETIFADTSKPGIRHSAAPT
jgi:hypothetical protein